MKHVIVTTEFKGVFYGEIDPSEMKETTITLHNANNVIYWHSSIDGFIGLSNTGPNDRCTIGKKAGGPIVLHKVTSITECSEKAIKAWKRY